MDMAAFAIPERSGRHNAFTFIEVIAALAIVSIALLGLLHLHLLSIRTADTAQTMADAVFLAQEKLAEALCSEHLRLGTNGGTVETNGARFTWRTEVTNFNLPQLKMRHRSALRRVHVDVTWHKGAESKNIQMTTCVADNSLHE